MRSTMAPEISAGVMIANISWNIACACSGIVAPYAASGSNPTPLNPAQESPPHQGARVVRALERRALDGVGVHGGERGVVVLARPDANHALNGLDEDLAVTHLAGAGRRQDGLDARFHEGLRAHHLDLDLFVEL